jgi:hypothetical protein
MFCHPWRHGLGAALAAIALASCGGIADQAPTGGDAGRHRDAGRDAAMPDRIDAGNDAGPDGADADSALPVYVEDACPPSTPDPPSYECDPFSANTAQCAKGYGCYPVPPAGNDPCHPGSWGTKCQAAGTGTQGTSCNGSRLFCASGYVCVKSGAGDQCVKLCRLQQLEPCTDGLVCNPLDVIGFGGCL